MHNKGYVHRDIKLENIMFEKNCSFDQCKIIDFGFARKYTKDEHLFEVMGSPLYMSPQILDQSSYTEKFDILSTGIILYFLWYGKFPYKSINLVDLKSEISKTYFKKDSFLSLKGISDQGKNFLLKLLAHNENERPAASQLIKDFWFQSAMYVDDLTKEEKKDMFNNIKKQKVL